MDVDQTAHRAIAWAIARALDLDGEPVRYATGSVPVFAVGDVVLKLFPSNEQAYLINEAAVLRRIEGRLPIPTPVVHATGRCEGWHYLVMSRLEGQPLDVVWDAIPGAERAPLMRSIGEAIAALHAVPHEALEGVDADWEGFAARWRGNMKERHAKKGLEGPWLEMLEPFLRRWAVEDDRRAILHTEIMRQHVLAAPGPEGWRITGLVDYEPSMVGPPDYELASVGVFTTCGEPGLLSAYLEGYGSEWEPSLPNRVMVHAIAHRYSNLKWYLERLGAQGATDLEGLAAAWFRP